MRKTSRNQQFKKPSTSKQKVPSSQAQHTHVEYRLPLGLDGNARASQLRCERHGAAGKTVIQRRVDRVWMSLKRVLYIRPINLSAHRHAKDH